MLALSKDELAFIIKALIEHKEKLEAMAPYPMQKDDVRPYDDLIHKLVRSRDAKSLKGSRGARVHIRLIPVPVWRGFSVRA
jgi:hypothetical protein